MCDGPKGVERARDRQGVGHVAFDQLCPGGQGRVDLLARRAEEILERDGGPVVAALVGQAAEQDGANVPYARQQRRHRRILRRSRVPRSVLTALQTMKSVDVLGVPVHDVTYAEALDILRDAIERRVPHVVTTPNPEFVMLARRDAHFRAALQRAQLNIPDGIGLILAARLAGDRLRQHVQGTDLVLMLAQDSARLGQRWFLLGGEGDVADRAGRALANRFPGLVVAGAAPGSPLPQDDEATRRLIQASGRIDVLLVAYGAPKQEEWLDRNLARVGVPVGIGVGGVFNYLSGDAPRAPLWVRRIHFEWLHRLLTQPWRWRRQLALPVFGVFAVAHGVRRRLSRASRPGRSGR
jgi:N-acetylglucosaminyldiphosphoundecaprenol N-acetyl-beta-D-mannosaminyltransferase